MSRSSTDLGNYRVNSDVVESAVIGAIHCACCTSSNISKKSSQNTCLKYCIPISYFINASMQGKKIYQEKLFNQFRLSDRVPENNFYRRLKAVLNLEYLYRLAKNITVIVDKKV